MTAGSPWSPTNSRCAPRNRSPRWRGIATDVDIVINNAGVLLPDSLLTGSFDDITTTFDVNVFGPLRVTRAFAPILAANGGGAVVNMHSVLSWLGGSRRLRRLQGGDLVGDEFASCRTGASQNTQVLGVHAGFIDTDMVADIPLPKMAPAEVARASSTHSRTVPWRCSPTTSPCRQGCAVRSCGEPTFALTH